MSEERKCDGYVCGDKFHDSGCSLGGMAFFYRRPKGAQVSERKIGDVVWIARLKHKKFQIVCPDCLGTKAVTLMLENGDRESLECKTCYPGGYEPPRGYITKTQYQPTAETQTIVAMEVSAKKTTYRFYNWSCDQVFDNEADAVKAAEYIRTENENNDYQRFVWKKEDSRQTWAWNCSYYRRQIQDAKKQIARAEAQLNVAKVKAKEPDKDAALKAVKP